jgi:transposase-like protein
MIPPRGEQARRQACKLRSTNLIERLNGEIKRRTDMVGIFPNEAAFGALILSSPTNGPRSARAI